MTLLNDFFTILDDTGSAVTIGLNREHVIYKAHFPVKPITPGVCIIKIVTELLERKLGVHLQLSQVKNLKFIIPISPIDDPQVTINFLHIDQETSGLTRARGEITGQQSQVFTKFSILYTHR